MVTFYLRAFTAAAPGAVNPLTHRETRPHNENGNNDPCVASLLLEFASDQVAGRRALTQDKRLWEIVTQ
jgi:hypothetical protein